MKIDITGKKLVIIVIIGFGIGGTSIFLVDWLDRNVINPRIWADWTCDEMKQFALALEDEKLTDFQRAKFHEDLRLCMGS